MSTRPLPRPPLTKRIRRGHWIAIDFVVATVMTMSGLLAGFNSDRSEAVPVATTLSLVVFLAVALRRLRPMTAFSSLASVTALAILYPMIGVDSMTLLAAAYVLYMVTVTSSRKMGVVALGIALAEIAGDVISVESQGLPGASLPGYPGTFIIVVAWMTGYAVRQRRAYVELLQVQAASSAVVQERLRIARELHDVVAHSMAVIAVQAGFGQYVIDDSPGDARDALGAIQATSRDALAELRRMLGVLRQQDVPASAPLTPECGLAELDRLVRTTRGGGIEVDLTRSGEVRDLPTGIDVSAYRIIQEALTNVVKHAGGGARCAVCVDYGEKALTIAVTDNGGMGLAHPHCASQGGFAAPSTPLRGATPLTPPFPGEPAQIAGPRAFPPTSLGAPSRPSCLPGWGEYGAGHGLIGMRERVQLCGGELSAGPLPRGGFRVLAQLPVPEAAVANMPELELVR